LHYIQANEYKENMAPAPLPSYTSEASSASSRGLSHPKRFITTHDEAGNAIFSDALEEEIPFQQVPNDAIFSLCYATNTTPVEMSQDADIAVYSSEILNLLIPHPSPPLLSPQNFEMLK